MPVSLHDKNILISRLFAIGCILHSKEKTFTLKNGTQSNIYIDMRKLFSYPNTMKFISKMFYDSFEPFELDKFDHIVGVPQGAIPFATSLSMTMNKSQLMVRNQGKKDYGTKKEIEGVYQEQDHVLVLEDVLTTAESAFEITEILSRNKLHTYTIFAIINRSENEKIRSLITLKDVLAYKDQRVTFFPNENANKCYISMLRKQSALVASLDYHSFQEILDATRKIADHVIGVKVHLDILEKEPTEEEIMVMLNLKKEKNLIMIEDRKLADIQVIAEKQILAIERKYPFIDVVTCHGITGTSMIKAFELMTLDPLLITELSCYGNLIDHDYASRVMNLASFNQDETSIFGLVCQNAPKDYSHLTFSPGFHLDHSSDSKYQLYDQGTKKKGLVWIVGRGITMDYDIEGAAIRYKEASWKYFLAY